MKEEREKIYSEFKDWLDVNLYDLTWQGKYQANYIDFWNNLFNPEDDIYFLFSKLERVKKISKIGPIQTWISWVKDKFIVFLFIKSGFSIQEISQRSKLPVQLISYTIKNYFFQCFPERIENVNEALSVGDVLSKNIHKKYKDLKDELNISEIEHEKEDLDLVLGSLEITLYPEWHHLNEVLKKDSEENVYISTFENIEFKKRSLLFVRDFVALVCVGALTVFVIQFLNTKYEKYLSDKIAIYQPTFLWLNKSLRFQEKKDEVLAKIEVKKKDFSKIEKAEKRDDLVPSVTDIFEEESEVILTSVDELPKNLDGANLEQSEYEESTKGGYRDVRYGSNKVYRVLMRSVDPGERKGFLNDLMSKYQVTQKGDVKPGTEVPGGMYYNLYVPRVYLKEFLAEVTKIEETTLYENRGRGFNPPGKNRVFIWVKRI